MSVLDTESIVDVLYRKGVISQSALSGSVCISAELRRNHSWKLRFAAGQSLFVKQIRPFSQEDLHGFDRELACHEFEHLAQADLVDRVVTCDRRDLWYVAELLDHATLAEVLCGADLKRRQELGTRVAHAIGAVQTSAQPPLWRAPDPFAIRFLRGEIENSNTHYADLWQLARDIGLNVRAERFEHTHFMHGDLRADNVRIGESEIKIIDWELSGWGAQGWDVAVLLSHLLAERGLTDGLIDDADLNPVKMFEWLSLLQPFFYSLITDLPSSISKETVMHWLPVSLLQAAAEFQRSNRPSAMGVLLMQLIESLIETEDPWLLLLGRPLPEGA